MFWLLFLLSFDWKGFVPNLAATLIGVSIAFWLDRRIAKNKKSQELIDEKANLCKAMSYLSKSLSYNKGQLISLSDTLYRDEDNLKIIFPLDLSTWEDFNFIINKSLTNNQLRYDLSYFFMVSGYLVKLQDRYFNYAIIKKPRWPKEIKYRSELLAEMLKNLQDFTKELLTKVDDLQCSIQVEQAKLGG